MARPDSRFHFDFAEFIPDFIGSDIATERLFALPQMRRAKYVFVTPDNSMIETRRLLIETSVPFIVPSYNISRGFRLIKAGAVPPGQAHFAAHLDGLEHFGTPVDLEEISRLGPVDMMITGASAISYDGIRFGKGHIYFDLEWGILSEIGIVTDETPVACLVHDVQLVSDKLFPSPEDVIVDSILTPTRSLEVPLRAARRRGIRWDTIDPIWLETIAPLKQLQRFRGLIH